MRWALWLLQEPWENSQAVMQDGVIRVEIEDSLNWRNRAESSRWPNPLDYWAEYWSAYVCEKTINVRKLTYPSKRITRSIMWQSVKVGISPVPSSQSRKCHHYGALGRELRKVLPQYGGIISPKVNSVSNIQKFKKIK